MPYPRNISRFAFPICAVLLVSAAVLGDHDGRLRSCAATAGRCGTLAISPDGQTVVTGSFDSTAIRWSLSRAPPNRCCVSTPTPSTRWCCSRGRTRGDRRRRRTHRDLDSRQDSNPIAVLEGHTAPIVALAASADGAVLASASWIKPCGCGRLPGAYPRVLVGPYAERQRRRVRPRRPHAGQRQLRSERPDLAAVGAIAPTVVAMPCTAQRGRDRRRRRDRGRRRRRQGRLRRVATVRGGGETAGRIAAGDLARAVARRRAGGRGQHRRIGGGDRSQDAQSPAHAGGAGAAKCGRWRSCPTAAPCSPAAPTTSSRAGIPATGEPVDTVLGGDGGRSAGRLCRRPRRGNLRACVACHTLGRRSRPIGRVLRSPASSGGASLPRRATIFPTPKDASTSSGPPRPSQNYSRSDPRPIRRGPRCRAAHRLGTDRTALVKFLERATRR